MVQVIGTEDRKHLHAHTRTLDETNLNPALQPLVA